MSNSKNWDNRFGDCARVVTNLDSDGLSPFEHAKTRPSVPRVLALECDTCDERKAERDRTWETGSVIIVGGTPIGNLGDASQRLRDALGSADTIASEDTRVTRRLLAGLGIDNRPHLHTLNDHNEGTTAVNLVAVARQRDVLVLSDAGMPTISDPGFRVVNAAVNAGVKVTVLPGPSAVVAALAVSGLATDRFAFEGFLPRKAGERAAMLRELARERRTMVFFESPHRLVACLAAMSDAFGAERRVAVCRELTKVHEEVVRGSLSEIAAWAHTGVRGEIAVVVAGAGVVRVERADGVAHVLRLIDEGTGIRAACAEVSRSTGLGRRELYEATLRARSP